MSKHVCQICRRRRKANELQSMIDGKGREKKVCKDQFICYAKKAVC